MLPAWIAGTALLALVLALLLALHPARAATGAAGTELLPNLVADPPDGTELVTDISSGSARLLLRFNGYVRNRGPGAVDFRGSREKPAVSKATEEEVEYARVHELGLPAKTEEELAVPPMNALQRFFTTRPGEEETNIEREHVDEPSAAEMKYVSADGHHHWHLQRVARYSLWNSSRSAEVAPAQKVGFCLEDSQHVEPGVGPSTPVYADNVAPYRDFCQQYRPNATSLFEGISPGWRDVYGRELAFQWVDASDVLPGEYWLREDVNPLGVIRESSEPNAPSYAAAPTIIPGFDALAQSASADAGEPLTLTLTARAFHDSSTPRFRIVSGPAHGSLGPVTGNRVVYTPEAGFSGSDSFTFVAYDPASPFPTGPAVASVSIAVSPAPSLLAGDPTATYTFGDQTVAGREEAFRFTAAASGSVQEMRLRTSAAANPGITGVTLGVMSEQAGRPGAVLGQATAAGEPAPSSWIRAGGMSVPLVRGTQYWLAVLPLGSGKLHYNAADLGGGDLESLAGGLTALTAEPFWEAYDQGPVGLQALGAPAGGGPPPSIAIEGAPATMLAGTSAQLAARVANDSSAVVWSASAGTITSSGLYTAPATPPAGGTVTISASLADAPAAVAKLAITIVAPPPAAAAPALPPAGGILGGRHARMLSRPHAMLIGRRLVMSTVAYAAGRIRLGAYLNGRPLGSCHSRSPARRTFTCRLTLPARVSLSARIAIVASLVVHGRKFAAHRAPAVIPQMRMRPIGGSGARAAAASLGFWCSPSALRGVLVPGG